MAQDAAVKTMVGSNPTPDLGQMMAQRSTMLKPYEESVTQAKQKEKDFSASKFAFEQEQKAKGLQVEKEALGKQKAAIEEAYKPLETLEQQTQDTAFIPSENTATELAALYGLIGVVGWGIGSGGKGDAMRAMSAMNGMLEGYQKGRQDVYKKEKEVFDLSVRNLRERARVVAEGARRNAELSSIDRDSAKIEQAILAAEQGADFYKNNVDKFGYATAAKNAEELLKAADKMYFQMFEVASKQAKSTGRPQLVTGSDGTVYSVDADANATPVMTAGGEAIKKQVKSVGGAKEKEGKTLTSKQAQEIEGLDSIQIGLNQLLKDFKPEFASFGVLGFGADLAFEAKRRLGDEKAQEVISWWSRYERFQAPNRHALFGATLTGNELKNYQSFTAKKSDSADTVKTLLKDQLNYSRSIGENKKLSYEGAGYKVPDKQPRNFIESFSGGDTSNLQQEALKRFGTYEPEKYDYGFEDNKFYRDAK
jgi:hypothetical protein